MNGLGKMSNQTNVLDYISDKKVSPLCFDDDLAYEIDGNETLN